MTNENDEIEETSLETYAHESEIMDGTEGLDVVIVDHPAEHIIEPEWPARIVKVKTDDIVLINRGSNDGLKLGIKLYLFSRDEDELFDPETSESLGHEENIKGIGRVIHLQEKIAHVQSVLNKGDENVYYRNPGFWDLFFSAAEASEDLNIKNAHFMLPLKNKKPFDEPHVGDYVKPIPQK